MPSELIHYITEYLYHYKGHQVAYKTLCTSCFQLGYYKIIHSKKRITQDTILFYFGSWIDDYYSKEVQSFFSKKYIPYKIEMNSYNP